MSSPPSMLHKGAVAVITGGASGIGLASALRFAQRGMSVFLADIDEKALKVAEDNVKGVEGVGEVLSMKVDTGNVEDVVKMREKVLDEFGEVHVLLNNAGTSRPCPAFSLSTPLAELQQNWATTVGTNLHGIINVAQVFAPHMARQENASAIVCTGSKQGITCPPGNAGYNVSKAGVKAYTEQLAHELRNTPGCNCTAHLFVPGWTYTGMTRSSSGKPAGAWTAEQTVDYMLDKVFDKGNFYVICPDNETSSQLDKLRIEWSLGDILQNRPPLSRWHPEYTARFEEFITTRQGLQARSRSRGRPMIKDEYSYSDLPSPLP
ncbi:short-chain dehydrogenase/reductase SDR [Tremella mesenterica]|uniref:Short-chain dehydrogenase/reductase SDR n=1 Tax=Tremella mesenterica TaxID=5217 RepID=A0A4Q1BU28_TREME|nr:uncharacterized protein TREMEDRAFT_42471 [Tremella mesenterica DSM 1558]EIW73665.1 hypothetical protein TREMEDRAFT_42471 [Tremella mesenterica DSM 1558]RXK41603.1 short-chain dehydrogenase/reductase SDR [Tremella mesenterica]